MDDLIARGLAAGAGAAAILRPDQVVTAEWVRWKCLFGCGEPCGAPETCASRERLRPGPAGCGIDVFATSARPAARSQWCPPRASRIIASRSSSWSEGAGASKHTEQDDRGL